VKGRFDAAVSGAAGALVRKSRRNRASLELDARVRFGGDFRREDAAQGTTFALFPDGTVCELQTHVGGSAVRYRLKLAERRGTVREQRGRCTPAGIPEVGGTVEIVHDGDGDPGTPGAPLLTGRF
jgi:hypothetical protein